MLELVLASVAWRRGWKARALIPLGLAFGFGFILAAAGAPTQEAGLVLFLPDLIATVVLGIMCLVPPSVPVEVRQGVTCHARDPEADRELEAQAVELFRRVGLVVDLDESQFEIATGLMSCAPAYVALVAEAQVDAGVRAGMPPDLAGELVAANIGGTAALLQARGMDTLAVRRMVTSPGGITARGLAALEHGGVRAAFDDAMQAVVTR